MFFYAENLLTLVPELFHIFIYSFQQRIYYVLLFGLPTIMVVIDILMFWFHTYGREKEEFAIKMK